MVSIVALLAGSLVSGCERNPHAQDLKALENLLQEADPSKTQEITALCRRLGPQGVERVRVAVEATPEAAKRFSLVKVLCEYNTNEHLVFAVDAIAGDSSARASFSEFLKGHLDVESRRLLQELVKSSSGDRRIMSCMLLQLVADDTDSLRIAETLLRENGGKNLEETAAFLLLLGDAAIYNNDGSVVALLHPYLWHKNREFRVPAMLALRAVPGEKAETELRDIAESQDDELSEMAASFLKTRLQDQRITRERGAPGWDREKVEED